jgi:DNA-binding XRE family transcriptional regulator
LTARGTAIYLGGMTGIELTKLRKQLAMTQGKLARAIGVTKKSVILMERGEEPILRTTELTVRLLLLKKQAARFGRFVSWMKKRRRYRPQPRQNGASLSEVLAHLSKR